MEIFFGEVMNLFFFIGKIIYGLEENEKDV